MPWMPLHACLVMISSYLFEESAAARPGRTDCAVVLLKHQHDSWGNGIGVNQAVTQLHGLVP